MAIKQWSCWWENISQAKVSPQVSPQRQYRHFWLQFPHDSRCFLSLNLSAPCKCPPPPGIGAGFYLGYSWLPSFFTKHVGIPQSLTLWMVLSGMIVFTFVVPVSVCVFLV